MAEQQQKGQELDDTMKATVRQVSLDMELQLLFTELKELEGKIPVGYHNYSGIIDKIQKLRKRIVLNWEKQESDLFESIQSAFDTLDLAESVPSSNQNERQPAIVRHILDFCFQDMNGDEATKLAIRSAPLERMDVNWSSSKWDQKSGSDLVILNNLLQSSMSSLMVLRIEAHKLFTKTVLTDQKMTMPNLKFLSLFSPKEVVNNNDKSCISLPEIVPKGIKLSQKFPNLVTLVLRLPVKFDRVSLKKVFPGDYYQTENTENGIEVDVLESVKNLALDCKFTYSGIKSFAKKFPNVTNMLVKNVTEIFWNDDSYWFLPWEHLTKLELRGFALGDKSQFGSRSLDSFFTGISNEICEKLRRFGKNEYVHVDLRLISMFRSVRDLEELKMLKIVFDHPKNAEWRLSAATDNEKLAFSRVTGLYSFNRMPKLKDIVFAYDFTQSNSQDIADALDPLTPFVNFVHHPMDIATTEE